MERRKSRTELLEAIKEALDEMDYVKLRVVLAFVSNYADRK